MDRVGVARDAGVATAQIGRNRPGLDQSVSLFAGQDRRRIAPPGTPEPQIDAEPLPHRFAVANRRGLQRKSLSLVMGQKPPRPRRQRQPVADIQAHVLADAVVQMHQPHRRIGKVRPQHDPHLQRKGQDVRPCDRPPLLGRKAAQTGIGADGLGLQHHLALQGALRQDRLAPPGAQHPPHHAVERPADHGGARQGRVEPLDRHRHAPSRLWPQTRTTCPLTPPEAGSASQAMVSATSTGCPP
ncbi:hypothetical protein D3C80_1446880 [compost metagenome]